MDALAQLALMTKAKLVFESPGTFLSFPALTPISYPPDQMTFGDAATTQEMQVFAEFSTLTNALPGGTLFQPSLDQSLWDVYQSVLQTAQVAQGSLTDQQAADLAAAQAFLSVPGPGGLLVDSAALVAYKQYQQAWFAATENYNNQKITASSSSDPKVQQQWQDTGEPQAQANVQAAESDWEIKGFKAQVEQAQQVEQFSATQSPQIKWQSWTASFNPATDFMTNPASNSTFGPTIIAPSDIFQRTDWPTFSISGADIPNLVSQAPPELAKLFGNATDGVTIESLSFEYCSAALVRPWFRPDLFYARFWRMPDPSFELSDGNSPPTGTWPAYITAIVFARSLVVTTRSAGVVQPQPLRTFPVLDIAKLQAAPHPVPHPMPVIMRPQPVVAMAADREPMMMRPGMAGREPAAVHPAPVAINPALRARLNAVSFAANPIVRTVGVGAGSVTPVPVTPPPIQTQPVSPDISVLAFICKPLPKSPNPDLSLTWS